MIWDNEIILVLIEGCQLVKIIGIDIKIPLNNMIIPEIVFIIFESKKLSSTLFIFLILFRYDFILWIIDFFILPPSIKELKKRLVKRGRDKKEDIDLRLSYAIKEINHYKEYSYVLINQNVQQTVNEISEIIKTNMKFLLELIFMI